MEEYLTKQIKKLMIVMAFAQDWFFSDEISLMTKCMNNSNKLIGLLRVKFHSMNPKIIKTEKWITEYTNYHFFKLFRLERTTYELLVTVVGKADTKGILCRQYTGGHHPIDIKSQILIFLWYMATEDTLASIGDKFTISPTTVMNIVNKVLYFILMLKKTYICFPKTEEELLNVSRGFSNYPGTVGALDGCHIFIKVETKQQDSYIDRYRRHSINLMAICNANYLLTYVFLGFPGSAHDSRVFENSLLFRNIERHGPNSIFIDDQRFHLIGDSAFALATWLMKPYNGINISRSQRHHNYCLASDRVVIEHTFGILKGRWRRIQFINTYHLCKTIEIASAACILHNFCILQSDLWDEEAPPDMLDRDEAIPQDQRQGRIKRDMITESLYQHV